MNTPAYFDALRAIARPIRAADWPRSLSPVRRLLAELGSPQEQFSSVVVTGSVGKGTTCYQTARMMDMSGVGLFTSPHLHSFRERFVIDGDMISQAEFVEAMAVVQAGVERTGEHYSTFELATCLALWWFARRGVSIAVLEVSIGGRWDAVNVVDNVLVCFTPIEREHAAMLGGSLQTIAWVKAGIMRSGGVALSALQSPEVEAVLRHEAALAGTSLIVVEADELSGAACRTLASNGIIPLEAIKPISPAAHLPGRMETVHIAGKTVVIDGGHTPFAAQRLRRYLDELVNPKEPVRLLVGMLRDKSAGEFLSYFDRASTTIVFTQMSSHRAFVPEDLAAQFNFQYAAAEVVSRLEDALAGIPAVPEKVVVITGSLRMAAAAREGLGLLSADELAEADATRAIFEGEQYLGRLS